MKAEGGRQKAESSRQHAQVLSVYCLLPAASFFYGFSLTPVGRALLAGALLVSAYALARYWRSLGGRSMRVKLTLAGLRAVTFLALSLALAGLRVEYETATPARVLLAVVGSNGTADASAARGPDDRGAIAVAAALGRKGLEVSNASGQAFEVSEDDAGYVAALLLTDGAMRADEARRAAERLSARAGGAPVYVLIGAGEEEGAGVVVLESVTVLGRALRGVPVAVRCNVHARGMRGRESLVTISDDAKVQSSARINWTADDERQTVTLTIVPKVAGWVDYNAKAEAAGGEDASRLVRDFSLYVEERRLRVLFFESEPTWEAKFIRRSLEESGLFEVDYFAQVSRAATVGVSAAAANEGQESGAEEKSDAKSAAAAPEARLHATLRDAARLNTYDCIIVGATENRLVSQAEAARLRQWVERRGGGLMVLGGNSFNGSIAAPGGSLYALLPSEISAQSFSPQGPTVSQGRPLEAEKTRAAVTLTPTEAGAGGLFRGYTNAVEEAEGKEAALTGQGFRLGALRAGAIVFAVAGQPGTATTSETGSPLVAGLRYGAGRTLVFAPADSWRIYARGGEEEDKSGGGAFGALWQGMALWSSVGARPAAEIVLSEESPAEGSTITAEIRVRDASFNAVRVESLSARLQPLTEEAGDAAQAAPREIAFTPDASDPGVWRARFPLSVRGRFSLEADYKAEGRTGAVEKRFAVVAAVPAEKGAALDTLRRAARETGGDLIIYEGLDALAERAAAEHGKERVRRAWELRSWWPLAFILPLLLSAEWFARRWWKED